MGHTLRVRLSALGAAGLFFLTAYWLLTAPHPVPDTPLPDSAAAFAATRQEQLDRELAALRSILEDGAADASLRAQAQARLMDLTRWSDQEAIIREVLSARGFDSVVVSVREGSANVVVRAPTLSREEAAVILELTARETGLAGGSIKVVPIK